MDSLGQDLRLAARTLAKSPAFAATAILTLALGIGANTAIFSIVYGVLQRPLPYLDPSSLVLVAAQRDFAGARRPSNFSAFEIADWKERPRTFAALAAYSSNTLALEGPDGVEPLGGAFVSGDFFRTIGQPRTFDEADDADHPRVAMVSADAARDLFGDDPLGRTLTLPTRQGPNVTATVVGVVGNVKYKGLANPAVPTLYVPFAQQPWPTAFLAARTVGEPSAVAADLRRAIGEVDRRSGVVSIETLDDIRSQEVAPPAFRAAVLGAIAALAVALAAVGLSGVVGYTASRRTAEIGVRVALSRPGHVQPGRGDVVT